MKNFLRQRQQLSSAVSAEYRRVWWSFKIPTTNQKRCQFSTRTVICRRFTHLREYSSRFRGPALSLYRHMDPYPSLGHASVTHLNMMGQCTQLGQDQRRVLWIIDYEVSIYKLLFCIPTQDSKIFMDTIAMASSVKPLLETQLRVSKNLLIHLLMSVSSSVATLKWIVWGRNDDELMTRWHEDKMTWRPEDLKTWWPEDVMT